MFKTPLDSVCAPKFGKNTPTHSCHAELVSASHQSSVQTLKRVQGDTDHLIRHAENNIPMHSHHRISTSTHSCHCINTSTHSRHPELVSGSLRHAAFSLVEMLMALLVASLLLVALAPVVTKKFNENINIGSVDRAPINEQSRTLNFNQDECTTLDETNNVCKGEFQVPSNFSGTMYVTVLGAGGGGAAGASTGTVEYKTEGDSYFTVPLGVDEITVTVVSGGQGGYAGTGTETPKTFTTPEVSKWSSPPAALKGRYVAVMGCGGGGGGGGGGTPATTAGSGGSGGFRKTPIAIKIDSSLDSIPYQVGGGGGGAGDGGGSMPSAGGCGGGGDGGCDNCGRVANNTCKPKYGGTTGYQNYAKTNSGVAAGGGYVEDTNIYSESGVIAYTIKTNFSKNAGGGSGNGGGNGGASGVYTADYTVNSGIYSFGGGGGGGKYGGGGGGTGCDGPGGGGGGPTYFNNILIGSGGGGGGGQGASASNHGDWICPGGGGGGGGGKDGGKGGQGGDGTPNNGVRTVGVGGGGGYPNGVNGSAGRSSWDASDGSDIYGPSLCAGGNAGLSGGAGQNGFPGVIRLTYLNYTTGGKGGGTGKSVTQTVKVIPGETLKITVGSGGEGGKSQYINSTAGTTAAVNPKAGSASTVSRKVNATTYTTLVTSGTSNTTGGGAANGLKGGNGAKINGMGCTVGVGGDTDIRNDATSPSDATLNAKNYGGCGGGGGYALSRGGNGSFGYVKITWNPNKKITGGGGGSGNSLDTTLLDVKPNTKIPFQIGRGGAGGKIEAGVVVEAQKGGDTIFGTGTTLGTKQKVTAGGGFGGKFPVYNTSTALMQNGLGGGMASLCKIGLKTMLTCTSAINGDTGTNTKGGNGAESYLGKGGDGGSFNLNGGAAEALGAGGGGAGVYNAGTNVTIGSETTNAIKGGNGGNGQIKLRWFTKE